VKEAEGALELATAEAMKGLSDAQVHELLERKWIDPLVEALEALPRKAVDELVAKIGGLKDKYGDTYADVAQQISETERELDEMLGQLVGNDFDMLGIAELRNLLGGGRHD
jgi:type I restriction enzyme M protein